MDARPTFLGREHGGAFDDPDVAAAYHTRPPYPDTVFELLGELIVDRPRAVLDLGCGTGALACRLAPLVDRVDAVDLSAPMIEAGKRAPGGDHPAIRWIVGRAEDVPLQAPYALISAGASLHWMEWGTVLPRLGAALTPRGRLAIVNEGRLPPPWQTALVAIIRRYSANQDFQPGFDLPTELVSRACSGWKGAARPRRPASFSRWTRTSNPSTRAARLHGRESAQRQRTVSMPRFATS